MVIQTQTLAKLAFILATLWLREEAPGADLQFKHHFIDRSLPVTEKLVGDYGLTAPVDLDRDGDLDLVLGDFESETCYESCLGQVLNRGNHGRRDRLAEELALMKPLPPTRLSEYDELTCTVGSASTIRVKKVGYSVPARLIGQELKVEVYEREGGHGPGQ